MFKHQSKDLRVSQPVLVVHDSNVQHVGQDSQMNEDVAYNSVSENSEKENERFGPKTQDTSLSPSRCTAQGGG